MGLNIKSVSSEEFKNKLHQQVVEEKLLEIPSELINFSRNEIIKYCLSKKVGLKENPKARVLVNWVEKNLVKINPEDKGKIKRFDKLESTWLNILVELRGFGMSIESLQKTRKLLFDFIVNDFSLFKFHFLNTILREQQVLIVFKEGDARIMSSKQYLQLLQRNFLQPHLNLNLEDFIRPEYQNNSLKEDFKIAEPFENVEKMKLLYFLKTGDYQNLKIKLTNGDVRFVENAKMVLDSEVILKSFSEWNFESINVSIDDETETIISSKK